MNINVIKLRQFVKRVRLLKRLMGKYRNGKTGRLSKVYSKEKVDPNLSAEAVAALTKYLTP